MNFLRKRTLTIAPAICMILGIENLLMEYMYGQMNGRILVHFEHTKSSSLASDLVLRNCLALYFIGVPSEGSPHRRQLWPSEKLLEMVSAALYRSIYNAQYLTFTVCQVLVHPSPTPTISQKLETSLTLFLLFFCLIGLIFSQNYTCM